MILLILIPFLSLRAHFLTILIFDQCVQSHLHLTPSNKPLLLLHFEYKLFHSLRIVGTSIRDAVDCI